jgi:predicted RNase H-like nuclease (RuvC/YqgF family)
MIVLQVHRKNRSLQSALEALEAEMAGTTPSEPDRKTRLQMQALLDQCDSLKEKLAEMRSERLVLLTQLEEVKTTGRLRIPPQEGESELP